jgi:hypothetical protein
VTRHSQHVRRSIGPSAEFDLSVDVSNNVDANRLVRHTFPGVIE